jgi:transposase-like protein
MSEITIQCRLVASEETLRYLWELMAQKNTPLINELLEQIGRHPDLEAWLKIGKVPTTVIKALCDSLKAQERFAGQPGRFYSSAIALVDYIYRSWIALQRRRQRQIARKERWLTMLKSDRELEQESNCSLDAIRTKAREILAEITANGGQIEARQTKSKKKTKKSKSDKATATLFDTLFKAYIDTEDPFTRCTLAYLLKNNCQVSELEENLDQYALRRRKKEIEIERLREQLKSRIPKGRDLTGKKWLDTLETATHNVPIDENEAKSWQASLLRKSSPVPFPITYESSEDLGWKINDEGRIFVHFNGLSKHKFEIYCDLRHLQWFKRFVEDRQIKHDSENQLSASWLTLRSGRIVWRKGEGKGNPWNVYRLTLHCCVDTRLWTMEGTQQVIKEKIDKINQQSNLTEKQQASLRYKNSTLVRINNCFPRPSKSLYQGQAHILVGVSLGLDKLATIAVVDASKNKVLIYRTVKQLLGKNYQLLNRQRQQQQRIAHERHKAQKQNAPNSFGESELGKYVDRLLAASIVAIAKTYSAGSIVLPELRNIREQVSSEIQGKAEKEISGYKQGQQKYAKSHRVSVHRWSYGRLMGNIQSFAAKTGYCD